MNDLLQFYKYQGTGNDFIIIDHRNPIKDYDAGTIKKLCDRRFGIGADGFIALQQSADYDFAMKYYNADGNESSMCGNGGRCIVQFAHDIGIIGDRTKFVAIDGPHEGLVSEDNVQLKMTDVSSIDVDGSNFILDTGSPHYVLFKSNIDAIDLVTEARKVRYSPQFPKGINVNFVEITGNQSIKVRTYERGVEDETYSCGTGVVASSLCFALLTQSPKSEVAVTTKGGHLGVQFEKDEAGWKNIYLRGRAEKVFEGSIQI